MGLGLYGARAGMVLEAGYNVAVLMAGGKFMGHDSGGAGHGVRRRGVALCLSLRGTYAR